MLERDTQGPEIALIGGDGRSSDLRLAPATVRSFPSPRYAGNGSLRRAIAAIDGGKVELVVLLVRWLGHSDFRSIVATCKAGDVPVLLVAGGMSAARRRVREFLGVGSRDGD